MKIYLISNNSLLEDITYSRNEDLDDIRKSRPLSIEGEKIASDLANNSLFNEIDSIYSSLYSSAISTAKYMSIKYDYKINLSSELNDCKVGLLGSKNMKMVKGLQDHEFTYKLPNGESLIDAGNRIDSFIKRNIKDNTVIFTHKRTIVGFLLKYTSVGYNLDENLILQYNDEVIYDDSETNIDIYEVTISNNEIEDIKRIS